MFCAIGVSIACKKTAFFVVQLYVIPPQINGHEVPVTDPPHIALYECTSMLEHNCRANCAKSFTNHGRIVITAGENINIGDHLSICYTDPMWGTLNRRQFLFESKFFWCDCPRCSDPTEFGTHFSSFKCQNGFVIVFVF